MRNRVHDGTKRMKPFSICFLLYVCSVNGKWTNSDCTHENWIQIVMKHWIAYLSTFPFFTRPFRPISLNHFKWFLFSFLGSKIGANFTLLIHTYRNASVDAILRCENLFFHVECNFNSNHIWWDQWALKKASQFSPDHIIATRIEKGAETVSEWIANVSTWVLQRNRSSRFTSSSTTNSN